MSIFFCIFVPDFAKTSNMKKIFSADELVRMPKKIMEQDEIKNAILINYSFPLQRRFTLVATSDSDLRFLFQIDQSSKISIKLSLHCMMKDNNIGLYRVDYLGTHRNPMVYTDKVPEDFREFAGQIIQGSHVHYFIEGEGLDWAKPIERTDVAIKEITQSPGEIVKAIEAFAKYIGIQTSIKINQTLL